MFECLNQECSILFARCRIDMFPTYNWLQKIKDKWSTKLENMLFAFLKSDFLLIITYTSIFISIMQIL